MKRIKISDGDLLIVAIGGDTTQQDLANTREKFDQWIKEREGCKAAEYSHWAALEHMGLT